MLVNKYIAEFTTLTKTFLRCSSPIPDPSHLAIDVLIAITTTNLEKVCINTDIITDPDKKER